MEKENITTEKLTDKAFSRMMTTSILCILLCIFCLCSATWALFTAEISYDKNELTTGNFDLILTVTDDVGTEIAVIDSISSNSRVTFTSGKTYRITLKMTENTTIVKGFCTIKFRDRVYHTDLIRADESDPFVFYLTVTDTDATLNFTPSWGIPAHYDVTVDGTLEITP